MHPFSLKEENLKQVTGGKLKPVTYGCDEAGGGIVPKFPPMPTTQAVGEEGGLPVEIM